MPVFDALMDRDPTARTWLLPLLRLGSRAAGRVETSPGELVPGHLRWWGKKERRLDPPKALLRWLVAHASRPASESLWGGPATRAKRECLVARDPRIISEALRLLERRTKPGVWYVLEGRSKPDAYLETNTVMVVIEGKRTESGTTEVTTWMPKRSQMLRHMDAAWDTRNGKRVFGLMIVEGPGGAEGMTPSDHWVSEAENQLLPHTLMCSLPHRSLEDREQIAEGFLGVTTWQKLSREFRITWPPGSNVD